MTVCKICESTNIYEIYKVDSLPLFQNKVYETQFEAQNQKTGIITLVRCQNCGFIFNATFDSSLIEYDADYQNEQSYSDSFVTHLDSIIDFLEEQRFKEKKIIEIGCGKGFFLEFLKERGFQNITGFDPAYEGDNPDIIKDYFGEKYKSLNADLIILRHVLEHIEKPYSFLQMLKDVTGTHTQILIEVPDFNWIKNNSAFWDIYYEHCNYFEFDFFRSFFYDSIIKSAFGGQYMYILSSLKQLKQPNVKNQSLVIIFKYDFISINKFLSVKRPVVIWGASSKGVTLLNLLDKKREFIKHAVDINPKKQNKFIATTGHQILNPESLLVSKINETVIVTNNNYFEEIVNNYKYKANIQFYSLEKLING